MTRLLTLTLPEAAEALGRSRDFVRALIADDLVDGRRIRGRWYVTAASLERWIDTGEPEPEKPEPVAVMPEVILLRGRREAT
jgi:hypothetical protein